MSSPAATDVDGYPTGYSRLFWWGLALGSVIMAVGVRGLIVNRAGVMPTNPPRWALLALTTNVVHDLVVVPVVLAVGWAVTRLVPQAVRAPVQGGLIASAIVVAYALPLVLRLGADPNNVSILPRDYGWGLAVLLAVIWATAAAVLFFRRWVPAGGADSRENEEHEAVTPPS